MRTMFVIAGRAPAWVVDQTSYAAKQLTEDGRVMVAITSPSERGVHLPGEHGGSTLLGIASSGYPVWTGRISSALGFRRRRNHAVIVLFDQSQPFITLSSAIIARVRGERVLVHDLTTPGSTRSKLTTFWQRAVERIANDVLPRSNSEPAHERSVALAICDGDREFAKLIVDAALAMAEEAAAGWRIVVQSSDPEIDRLVAASGRPNVLSCESGPVPDDLFHLSDVVVVRHGEDDHFAAAALQNGASAVIVGHPVSGRILRRFDGAWLTKHDVSSILVALESSRGAGGPHGRSAPAVRKDGDELVRVVREYDMSAA